MFFIAVFHLAMGLGLMFSQPFQEWAMNALTSVSFLSQAIAAAMLLRLSKSEVPERRL